MQILITHASHEVAVFLLDGRYMFQHHSTKAALLFLAPAPPQSTESLFLPGQSTGAELRRVRELLHRTAEDFLRLL